MKTYIITGGAGFIGSALAHRLIALGGKVYVLDDLSTGFDYNIPEKAIFYRVDCSNAIEMAELNIPEKVDVIFHLAAQPSGEASFDDPARDIDVNYKATYNMLKLAEKKNCPRFIYASSMSVYGDANVPAQGLNETFPCMPVSYYGANKLASEKLIGVFNQRSNIKETILRLFNVYGPGQNMANMKQGMVSIYFSFLVKNCPVHVKGTLDRFRDFIYINDVVDVFIAVLDCQKAFGGTYNVGTGVKTTVEALLRELLNVYGKDDFKAWVKVQGNTAGDIKGFIADIGKLKNLLNWQPKFTLSKGLLEMKKWLDQTRKIRRENGTS